VVGSNVVVVVVVLTDNVVNVKSGEVVK
jgi:hypothetical protein